MLSCKSIPKEPIEGAESFCEELASISVKPKIRKQSQWQSQLQ